MGTSRHCDICKLYKQLADGSSSVHRYSLRRPINHRKSNKTAQGLPAAAGGIDLCDECWKNVASKNLSPAKQKAALERYHFSGMPLGMANSRPNGHG